jgi:hypothetical protein
MKRAILTLIAILALTAPAWARHDEFQAPRGGTPTFSASESHQAP